MMSISTQQFAQAQEQELVNWEKDISNVTRILYELVEHSALAGPLRKHLPPFSHVEALEVGVGCFGLGFLAPHLFDRMDGIDGVDPLPRLEIDVPDPALQTYIDELRGRVNYVQTAGEQLPFASESYDLVACINVVDHARSPESILREIHRVLRPGGLFGFSVSTLSTLGELKWKFNRRRRPHDWLFLAHPHTYQWSRADALLRSLFPKVLWCDRPSWTKRVAGHGRMSYWVLQKI
jgi:2-polyprenyl-3-methyl-5-hydroxy-6-metoxy-1,4-benzoquinol methylase